MQLTDNLKWRYATKKFDNTRKVVDADIAKIQGAVQLSASSYGLQLYKICFIQDIELRKKLREVSFNQPQITDASHLVVFCNYAEVKDEHVDKYLELTAQTRNIELDALQGFGSVMKNSIKAKSKNEVAEWTARQTYIALGTLLAAASELRIDICPMEGFKPEKYNEILGLNEKGLNAAVIATIGYRSVNDEYQHAEKVRKPKEELFVNI